MRLAACRNVIRPFLGSRSCSTSSQFDRALQDLNRLQSDPDPHTKLKLYGLFKQATVGKVNVERPAIEPVKVNYIYFLPIIKFDR